MAITDFIEIGRMDEFGRMDTPVHRLDSRAKAIVTITFIIVVMSFPRYSVSALTPFFLYPLLLLAAGQIPVRPILKKILVAAPFALIIGIFNPFLDQQPVATAGQFVITGGWLSFTSIMLRFVLTVSAALILVACTGMHKLCAGLGQLGVPDMFVTQLLFLYRYLFVVADQGVKMMRSVELRSTGTRAPGLRVYGSLIGNLLLRSMDRSERVYRAMVSRGFNGEIRVAGTSAFRAADFLFVIICLAFFASARMWNLAGLIGRLFTGATL